MRHIATIAVLASLTVAGCSSSADQSESSTSVSLIPAETVAEATAPAPSTVAAAASTVPGSTETTPSTAAPAAASVETTAAPVTTAPPATAAPATTDVVTEDDLIRFIAAAEVPIEGTSLEGVVFDAPEIYIAIAHSACTRFTQGDGFGEIAADLLIDLESGEPADDEALVGALIGAATRTICPEHADKI
jgi:outer membrane murein-binding lipoprotein Lpp